MISEHHDEHPGELFLTNSQPPPRLSKKRPHQDIDQDHQRPTNALHCGKIKLDRTGTKIHHGYVQGATNPWILGSLCSEEVETEGGNGSQ